MYAERVAAIYDLVNCRLTTRATFQPQLSRPFKTASVDLGSFRNVEAGEPQRLAELDFGTMR